MFATSSAENIQNSFILFFMADLDSHHRKLESLRRLIDTADRAGVKVYFYITPLDHERGEKYLGKEFSDQVKKNTETVCAIIESKKHQCLDLSFSLSSDNFINPNFPDDHLNEKGRLFVASEVTKMF